MNLRPGCRDAGQGLGATWARIGETLGMSRQSAWERFAGEEQEASGPHVP